FDRSCAHRSLHSLPTRRSSDLPNEEALKLLSLPFQQVYVSVPTNHVTFIPETLFQASDLDKYAAFMENPGRELTHTELDFLNIQDRKSTRLNSSHVKISYAVFC